MESFPSDVQLAKVEIHVTEVCNNRCGFCTTGWINAEDSDQLVHVPRETIRQQLLDAYATGARRALFQGGEPTVRRDLGELLSDSREIGYQATTIFTNARMAASKAGARWLAGMNATWFQVSIQGGTAEAHDASVGAIGAFEQTVRGTRRLIEMGQRVKINAVLTRHLLDSLEPFAKLIIDLGPEEIGMDTVKPGGAFTESRASYADLVPKLGPYASAIRDAVLQMDAVGTVVRLTSFPPCLAPGVEHLVSEEAPTTRTHQSTGVSVQKIAWKRSMQRKADGCANCAYDASCGGVYSAYAEVHGLDELHPLAKRAVEAKRPVRAAAETALTRALRSMFVAGSRADAGVRAVRSIGGGGHELECFTSSGTVSVTVAPRTEAKSYATTERFAVAYRRDPAAPNVDLRIVDAVVRGLRRFEQRWNDEAE